MSLLTTLNKPFPEYESKFGLLKTTIVFSLFVTFFLYVFLPFGLHTLESNKFWVCLGFGSMTFFASLLYDLVVTRLLKLKGHGKQWTFGKWLLNMLGIMLTISIANFLFARLVLFGFIDWSLLPDMIYGTFMIGLLPTIALGIFSVLTQEKKYQDIASLINQQKEVVAEAPFSESERLFDISIQRIKYVEALQNYVSIGYVDANNQFHKKTERSTLKQILEDTSGSSIIKSHRSFLVNKKAIVSISGNAQGLLLELSDCDKTIPVSRSYVAVFRNK